MLSDLSHTDVARITYAQNFEDVRLWKALAHVEAQTYVDVGAGHPTDLSVTRLFYDRGWRGINIEPGPKFSALERERSDDVNLNVAVDTHDGSAKFYVAEPYADLSSLNREAPSADPTHVSRIKTIEVKTSRLDTILSDHLGDRPIAFLKIDTEGTESDVLASNDWDRYRPLVVVVEAITPGTHGPSHEQWEATLLAADYVFATFDGINNFYVEGSHRDLVERLQEPVAPVEAADSFTPYPQVHAEQELIVSHAMVSDYVGRVRQLDAELKSQQMHNQRLDAFNRELDQANQELSTRINELLATWSWKIGTRIMAVPHRARPYLGEARQIAAPVVERGVKSAHRLQRIRSSSPERLRSAYRTATASDAPLETVKTMRRKFPYFAGADTSASNQLDALWARLASRRMEHPLLIETDELDLLEAFVANDDGVLADWVSQMLVLRRPSELAAPSSPPTTLVIDVRALQIPVWCGTKTHAANVLRAALACVQDRGRTLFVTSPTYPPLDPEIAALGDGVYGDEEIRSVGAYLQLAPFVTCTERSDLELLRAPWIKKATVWLDAIPGHYPHAFLTDTPTFFWYQLGLEKMTHHEWILALSQSAANDVLDVLDGHEQVIVTGCRSSIGSAGTPPPTERPASLPPGPYVLVVGNALPHKNLAAAVTGFVPVADTKPAGLKLVIVANIPPHQQEALQQLGRSVGLEAHQLVFLSQITTEELAYIHAEAEAVIVPSIHEGFSLPVLESVEVGTPVVLSDIPAHRELLQSDAWFFPDDDPVALADSLGKVIADPTGNLAAQRSQLGHRFDGKTFDDKITGVVEALIADFVFDGAVATPAEPDIEEATTEPETDEAPVSPSRPFSLSKICELEDFADPRFEPIIRDVFSHELVRFGPEFPRGREWRKYWEVAMAVLAFKECGLLDGTRELLGIGAGNEPTLFYLTRFARRVLATDIYLAEGWEESAHSSMLTTPEYHWPFAWNPDRLAVEDMDALDLRLPDESVDGVFSSSSVEHFGDRSDVSRSIDEAFRVLRPGGVLSVSTEFRLRGERPGVPGVLMFDEEDIDEIFLGTRDWSLVEPFDSHVSPGTMATATDISSYVAEQQVEVERLGGLWTHHMEYSRYPHIVLKTPGREFTSFHIALRKAGQLPQ